MYISQKTKNETPYVNLTKQKFREKSIEHAFSHEIIMGQTFIKPLVKLKEGKT